MNILFSTKALGDYKVLSRELKKIIDKQFDFLLGDLRHPSLHAKKYEEARDVWQARINKDWRFYFCPPSCLERRNAVLEWGKPFFLGRETEKEEG